MLTECALFVRISFTSADDDDDDDDDDTAYGLVIHSSVYNYMTIYSLCLFYL